MGNVARSSNSLFWADVIDFVSRCLWIFLKMDFRIEIFTFKLVYTEKIMLFGLFRRELLCFEHLDISLNLTGICCCSEKISLQQQIPLKCIGKAKS